MSSVPAIAVAGLCKSFDGNVVLDGINLTVAEGTIFALLGPNGAGKTTMVQILSTLIPAGSARSASRATTWPPIRTQCAPRSGLPASSPRWTIC
jgi:ABC-2 type transport system ATP-binding protein